MNAELGDGCHVGSQPSGEDECITSGCQCLCTFCVDGRELEFQPSPIMTTLTLIATSLGVPHYWDSSVRTV